MQQSITYVALDVHQDTITRAVLPGLAPDLAERKTVSADISGLLKWLRRVERKCGGELRVCYEASGAGYVLYRELSKRGIHCEVVAPSKIPQKPGDRRKTDAIDARDLAYQYRNGSLTMVVVPDREDEALQALVRWREALVGDLTRAKHRTRTHLQRNGFIYRDGSNWTKRHREWLGRIRLEFPDEQPVGLTASAGVIPVARRAAGPTFSPVRGRLAGPRGRERCQCSRWPIAAVPRTAAPTPPFGRRGGHRRARSGPAPVRSVLSTTRTRPVHGVNSDKASQTLESQDPCGPQPPSPRA